LAGFCDSKVSIIEELLSRTADERNIEADIHLSSEEAAEEKVYE